MERSGVEKPRIEEQTKSIRREHIKGAQGHHSSVPDTQLGTLISRRNWTEYKRLNEPAEVDQQNIYTDEKAKTHLRIPRQFLFRINIDCNQIDGVTGGPGSKIRVVGHFLEDGRNDAAGCAPTIRV